MLLTSPRLDRSVPLIPSSAANSDFSCKIFLVSANVYIFFKFIFVDTNVWFECRSILFKFQIWFTKLLNHIEYILMITLGSCSICNDTTRILYRPISRRVLVLLPCVPKWELDVSTGFRSWHRARVFTNGWYTQHLGYKTFGIPIISDPVLINC